MSFMDFQFSADGDHHHPPISDSADGGLHRPPFSVPTGGGNYQRTLLPMPTAGGSYQRPPPPNTAAAYFPAPMHTTFQPNQIPPPPHTFPSIPTPRSTGFPGDVAARKLRKAQIRAEILARESDESRLLEEEVRRELYFERCMAERLREVERLGSFTPTPGNETPLRENEGSITASLCQLQSLGLMLPSPAVEPIQAPNYVDFCPGNMPSHPISHRLEARVGEMPLPVDNPQVWERPLPDANFQLIEDKVGEMPIPDDNAQVGERPLSDPNFHPWVGERPLPDDNPQVGERPLPNTNFRPIEVWKPPPSDANLHSLEARGGDNRPPNTEIDETHNNLSDIGLALRPPGDSDIGEQHESETVPKPKRDRAEKRKLTEIKIKKMPERKAPATSGNFFQCGQPGHRPANCPASKEVAQHTDENITVKDDGAANDKCSRCGQNGHSRANCHASEEEAEWYKFTQEISDSDEGEVSEAQDPPANNNCFHCGEVGHQRANCPLSREAKRQKKSHQMRRSNMVAMHNLHAFGASNRVCHGCGKIGHMMRECRFLKKQIRRAEGAENMKHKVPLNGVDPAPGFGGKCFICGQSGHLRKQCPVLREKFVRFEDSFLGKRTTRKRGRRGRKQAYKYI